MVDISFTQLYHFIQARDRDVMEFFGLAIIIIQGTSQTIGEIYEIILPLIVAKFNLIYTIGASNC